MSGVECIKDAGFILLFPYVELKSEPGPRNGKSQELDKELEFRGKFLRYGFTQ